MEKKIKDLLALDLTEDIKDVIDLEDRSEAELQYEIETYIVTDKIASYLDGFVALYQSNIKETGVWLSGFYGSGKSYFGKMSGYILENRTVNGTQFRERFIQRLAGISKQSLLENAIRGLSAYDTKVVFLDIAKQNTTNGFAWTLFKNFLRALGFLDDVFGYMEYGLFLDGKYTQFLSDVERITGRDWRDIRKNPMQVPQIASKVLTDTIFTQDEYKETKEYLDKRITSYDAARFKEELSTYLDRHPHERIVFVIDEVSEAVGQKKIDLLELEGISEALSGIPQGKIWTIAIAQEKLEDVINNANLSVKELSKVIDRFKNRIHLSSEEVDTIIRKRLLFKNDLAVKQLEKFYSDNDGLIADSTSLNAKFSTKIDNSRDFVTYYPFHKYQFNLLQNFLFSVHQKAKTGGTERGMIIATHIILKAIKDSELFTFVTAHNLAEGGKKVVDGELERKYAQADKILKDAKSSIDGVQLLKTIYFLNESESVRATAESITKTYLAHLDSYYEVKSKVEDALAILCEANLLLEKSGIYKITSDLERKLIDEMKNISVDLPYKKRELVDRIKKLSFITTLSTHTFESTSYNFYLTSTQGDELKSSNNKYIKIQVASPYTVELGNRDEYIEKVKIETQSLTDLATLIPDMDHFLEIDKCIEEIYRYDILEDRYKNDDDHKIRGIVKDFSITKSNKVTPLNRLIEKAYRTGVIIYHFEEHSLKEEDFVKIINQIQEKIISNTYTARLPFQLSEDTGIKVLKEQNPLKLKPYFSGREFSFFDSDGNFIGERLRAVEKVVAHISSIFVDGEELEKQISMPPCGYSYGTLITVLSVLMRAGRISVRYNGNTLYNYRDGDVINIFSKSREFRKAASFKAITSSLPLTQRQQIVEHLNELKARDVLGKEFSYSTNDIDLVTIIGEFADYYSRKVDDCKGKTPKFDLYFPLVQASLKVLKSYVIGVTDSNYKSKAEEFLKGYIQFKDARDLIQSTIDFTESKLTKVENYDRFITQIVRELEKLGGKYQANPIFKLHKEFGDKFNESVINNYHDLEKAYQKIKDEYHKLIENEHDLMNQSHQALKKDAEAVKAEIVQVSESLNREPIAGLNDIINYAGKHTCGKLKIEYDTSCQSCHFSLNEIIESNQNISLRYSNIEKIKTQVKYPPPEEEVEEEEEDGKPQEQEGKKPQPRKPQPRKINLKSEKGEYTVFQYKQVLQERLDRINPLSDNDIVIVD